MKNLIIELPISKNYVAHWSFWEGMREILQNAIDTKDFSVVKSPRDNLVKVVSRGGLLDLNTLMLGESSKRDDRNQNNAKYGEGYKLAMLVLCREGYDVRIANGYDLWTATIAAHSQLGVECLKIEIEKDFFDESDERENSVEFVINMVTGENFQTLEDNYIELDFPIEVDFNSVAMRAML